MPAAVWSFEPIPGTHYPACCDGERMADVFDIYTIIFLALAVFIFLRLRSVLGQRTGRERPPYDPYSARDAVRSSAAVMVEPSIETNRVSAVSLRRSRSLIAASKPS